MAEVAHLSGFSSLRTFNAALQAHYRLTPTQVRATNPARVQRSGDALHLRLCYRPPFDTERLLAFFALRAIAGVEVVDTARRTLARTLRVQQGAQVYTGWVVCQFEPKAHTVRLQYVHPTGPVPATGCWRRCAPGSTWTPTRWPSQQPCPPRGRTRQACACRGAWMALS